MNTRLDSVAVEVCRRPARRCVGLAGISTLVFLAMAGFSQDAPAPGVKASLSADTIGGVIVDEQGQPIAGAKIEVDVSRTRNKFKQSVLPPNFKDPAPVQTDAAGRWQVTGVLPGVVPETPQHNGEGKDTYRFYITHPDFLFLECSSMGPFFGDDAAFRQQTARLVLKSGHVMRGMVRDEQGHGIAGATIQRNYGALSREDPSATTDAEGRYELKAARPEDLVMRVRAKGFALHQQRVDVKGDITLDFTLKPAKKLTLRLRDENNQPVTKGYVNFMPAGKGDRLWWANPDKDGLVTWAEAPAEEVTAVVVMNGFESVTKKVTAGAEIALSLAAKVPLPAITLQVSAAGTGTPLVGCTVTTGIYHRDSSDPRSVSWLEERTGEPMKPGTAVGDYVGRITENYQKYLLVFCVRREGHAPVITAPVDPKKGDATLSVKLQEREPAPVAVLTAQGTPAVKADVYVTWQDRGISLTDFELRRGIQRNEHLEFTGSTAEDGQCTIPACTDDASVLVVHESGFASAVYADLVKEGAIKLQPFGKVEATVKKDGKPAPGAKFEYQGSMALPGQRYVMLTLSCVSDAQGRIVLPRVFPALQAHLSEELPPAREGRSRVVVRSNDYKPTVSGKTTTFDLEAKGSVVRPVTGLFVLEDGTSLKPAERERLSVWLMHADPGAQGIPAMAEVGIDGRFHFEPVPPGNYELVLPRSGNKPNRYAFPENRGWKVTVPQAGPEEEGKSFNLGQIKLVDRDSQPVLQAPDGKALFRIRVRDRNGKPISGAKVEFVSARLDSSLGAAFGLSALGEPKDLPAAHSDAEGLVQMTTPARSLDGSAVIGMQTAVTAEGYVPTSNAEPLANRESTVTLETAAQLAIQVTHDGKPLLDDRVVIVTGGLSWGRAALFSPDAAIQSHVTRTARPGKRFVQAGFLTADGKAIFSPVIHAELKEGSMTKLTAPLQPGIRVAGKVDDQMPRPIREARIEVYVSPLHDGASSGIWWSDWKPLNEDGSFEFLSLPPGQVSFQVIGDGWISPLKADGQLRSRPWIAGAIDQSRDDLVIPMERTASCEVTVLDAQGKPAPGATVAASPNFSYDGFGNRLLAIGLITLAQQLGPRDTSFDRDLMNSMWERYKAVTDDQGRAVVHGLPAQTRWESLSVYPPGIDPSKLSKMPKRQGVDSLKSGETTKITLKLDDP